MTLFVSDQEKANLEHWKKSPLFRATQSIFGDIDHVLRVDNDLIVRGWLIATRKHNISIHIGVGRARSAPLFVNDLREDVYKAFPSRISAKTCGTVFLLQDVPDVRKMVSLSWIIIRQDMGTLKIPIEPKEVILSSSLISVPI